MDLFLHKLGRDLSDALRTVPPTSDTSIATCATLRPTELAQTLGKSRPIYDRSTEGLKNMYATVGRLLACCARAASGRPTTAPPRSIRNLRRLIAAP